MVVFQISHVLFVGHLENSIHELTIEHVLGLVVAHNVVGHQVGANFVVAQQLAFLQKDPHLLYELLLGDVQVSLYVLQLGAQRLHLAVVED